MKYLYVVIINFIIAILVIILIDLALTIPFFNRNAVSYGNDKVSCSSKLTGYNYCESIVQFNYMNLEDRVFPVINYIDKNKRSTYSNQNKKPPITKKIFLIGDSFIQADEISIEKRFEHQLRKRGYEVESHGYSSWNAWQFNRVASQLNTQKGDSVIIFSMANDYLPSYIGATINSLHKYDQVIDEVLVTKTDSIFKDYINQSFFANRFKDLKFFEYDGIRNNKNNSEKSLSEYQAHTQKCKIETITNSKLTYEYMLLSNKSSCWQKKLIDSVDVNIKLLNNTKKYLEAKGVDVKIFLVPAPWVFENQSTIGRMIWPNQFPMGTKTLTTGLTDYVRSKGLEITDLANYLGKFSDEPDNLYFRVDGHWTEFAHILLSKFLIEQLRL